jgi:hypothetical protein
MIQRYSTPTAIAIGLALVFSVTASAGPSGFTPQVQSISGGGWSVTFPWRTGSLAMGAFKGGGQMDAVVTGTYVAGIYIMLNGGWNAWVDTGPWPVAVVTADFDEDGRVDLAVCEQDGGGVAIYTNIGGCVLVRTAFYATGDTTRTVGPQAVLAVDLDKDGRLDLVVANRFAETVVVLHNTGGGFVLQQTMPVAGEPNSLVLADLDGDSWPDLAVACASDDTAKILKNTAGSLSFAATFPGGPYPVAIAAADLNADGFIDLAVADREAPQVTVLLNDGTGQFTAREVALAITSGPFDPPADVQLMDFNADGTIDLRCAGVTLYNDGFANFGPAATSVLPGIIYAQAFLSGQPYPMLAVTSLNTVTVTWQGPPAAPAVPGDITGDSHVNVIDLLTLADSWSLSVGHAGFLPGCDLNGDGSVNVVDLLYLADNWGK